MTRILPIAAAVAVLVAGGVVHGLWTDRWSVQPDAAVAAARMDTLPLTVGDWQGESLPVSPRELRGLAGYVARRYVNRATGDAVTLALMCGRPRVVSIHTPDVCYAGSGYEVAEPARFAPAGLPEPAAFWTTDMVRTRAAEQSRLRVFYAWAGAGSWEAPEAPRVSFAGSPVLYKMYLLRDLPPGGAPLAEDPCLDFFKAARPELRKCLAAPEK
ncbi:MAG TPA: exosortase-associated EpsI family protein [Gemmataceae bacterium]|nr:exosortase-associated EpsI family protein [Gemmataceae bacterium]